MLDKLAKDNRRSVGTGAESASQRSPGAAARTGGQAYLAAALAYARLGWLVFPLHEVNPDGACSCNKPDCGSEGKHPRTPRGSKDATLSHEQIRAWWAAWPTANLGIATG